MSKCVVSGSFDPITVGHMDIINRAKEIFDTVYVVMLINPEKSYTFTKEQRMNMLERAVQGVAIADFYDGYTVDYCASKGIKHIVRGIRNADSYAYEQRIDSINRSINKDIETVYLPAREELIDVSSTLIREKLSKGQSVDGLAPRNIVELIGEYYGKH